MLRPAALTLAMLIAADQVFAHHSGAMFDRTKTVDVVGTVKEYQFNNPHTWLMVAARDRSGKTVVWSIEGGSVARMYSFGATPDALQPGTKITVSFHPLRDGRMGGGFVSATLPDGKRLVSSEPGRANSTSQ